MRISPTWLREFVGLDVDNARLAEDLTHAGIAVEAISGHGDATVFEMDITTNRVDAMNHYGVARECSAIYDVDLKPIAPKLPKLIHPESFAIEILDPDLCARYTARVVCDVHIEKSPRYIAERLLIEEHHGINNIADASNYTLMEMGHPTLACDRVAELILETAGGKLGGYHDAVARTLRREPVQLDRSELRRILGQEIPESDVMRILRRLGFGLTPKRVSSSMGSAPTPAAVVEQPEEYTVEIPTWRMDVERDIDVIEEVARVYGFNNFANTLPSFSGGVVELPHALPETKTRSRLLALGYDETVSPTFISSDDAQRFSSAQAVAVENPLSEEAPLLRNSLLPGMLNQLAWNFNREANDVRLFEMGNVFAMSNERVEQKKIACFAATGSAGEKGVELQPRAADFFDLKGDTEAILDAFENKSLQFVAPASGYFHPGRSAKVLLNGEIIGEIGQLHPDVAAERKFKQE